jgi:translocation and assembly module TamA
VVACVVVAAEAKAAAMRAEVQGIDDKSLRQAIQQAIGKATSPPASRMEARRRAREAAVTAVTVLRSEGYYDAVVVPDIGDGDKPQPVVTVDRGPRTLFGPPAIDWQGELPDSAAQAAAQSAMALKPGDPARAADVVAAEGRIVAVVQKLGYADAEAEPREVIVDHADHSMHPTFHIVSGGLVHLDGVRVATKGQTNPMWVARLAPWKSGEIYKPQDVAELERRLRDTGVYDSVAVALAPTTDAVQGLRPVIASLADRPKGTLELGGSYSTAEGAGVDSQWLLYNRLHRADTITNTFRLAQIDSRIQTEFSFPHWRKPEQTLKLTGAVYSDVTPAYNSTGLIVSADITQRWGKTSFFTYGLSLDGSSTDEKEALNFVAFEQRRKLATVAGLVAFAVDRSNDPLDPSSGWRLDARVEPTVSSGDGSVAYLKGTAQLSGYLPLGKSSGTVIAGRIRLGDILGGDIPLVPPQDRFYAGGGGSVRGYGYQDVGPRYPDNTPEGGLSLFESSIEIRQRLTRTWGVAAFVDAGAVGTTIVPEFNRPQVGAGVGVRYNAGFGPIRLDIATPLDRRKGDAILQVYLSIGQSF